MNCGLKTEITPAEWFPGLFQYVAILNRKGYSPLHTPSPYSRPPLFPIPDCCCLSLGCIRLFATPWTVAPRDPLYMGFPRQEYWSGLPFPTPGDLPTQESNPRLLRWQAHSLPVNHQGSLTCKAKVKVLVAQPCLTLSRPRELQPTRLLCPWNSPGKNTGVGCHSLLQGIFPPRDQIGVSFIDRWILYH